MIKLQLIGAEYNIKTEILKKIPYFRNLLNDCELHTELRVLRSGMLFEYVLAVVIDPNYIFPIEYKSELDYYDINLDTIKFIENYKKQIIDLNNKVEDYKRRFNNLTDTIETLVDNFEEVKNYIAQKDEVDYIERRIWVRVEDTDICITDGCDEKSCGDCNYCDNHYYHGDFCVKRGCFKRRTNSLRCNIHKSI